MGPYFVRHRGVAASDGHSLTYRALDFISRRSRRTVWLIVVSSVLALGAIDYLTGSRIAITFFYLLPLSVASWSLGKREGRFVALLCALAMQSGPFLEVASADVPIALWNLAVRLAVFLVVADMVSEFRRLLSHQTELSRTDPLTGSLNRRAFLEAGGIALERMRRYPSPLTLAFLDIDNFKSVNDISGHASGDALLIAVADCLKSQLWGTDAVARLGGDEFGILLPHTSVAAAQRVLPRLRESLLRDMEEADLPVTVSIGVVTCSQPPESIECLLQQADQLMYAAKRLGKDRIEYGACGDHSGLQAQQAGEAGHLVQGS